MELFTVYFPHEQEFVAPTVFYVHPAIPIRQIYMQQRGAFDMATWQPREPDSESQATEE